MRFNRSVHINSALLLLLVACGSEAREETPPTSGDTAIAAEETIPEAAAAYADSTIPCLLPDSMARYGGVLVFGDSAVDTMYTGDITGLKLYVNVSSEPWTAEYQEAEGEWGSRHPLVDFVASLGLRGIEYTRPLDSRDTVHFRGTFTCDSIWGLKTMYGDDYVAVLPRLPGQ